MAVRWVLVRVALAASVCLCFACSSDDSEGDGSAPASGGTAPGTGGTSGSAAGGTAGTGGTGTSVDCPGLCERVRTICGPSVISDNWIDVCTPACGVRLQVTPDVALLEERCVNAATDCTTAVQCVASPTGSGGAGGSGAPAGAGGR